MTGQGSIWNEEVRGRTAEPGLLRLSGLDQLLYAIHGHTPGPAIHNLTGLRPAEAGTGRATFVMPATEWLQNSAGILPGGMLAFLADAPFRAAVSTGLPVGKVVTTAELSMSFVRPAIASGMLVARGSTLHSGRAGSEGSVRAARLSGHWSLIAEAEVTHRGRSIAIANAILRNAVGQSVAFATGSTLVLSGGVGQLRRAGR